MQSPGKLIRSAGGIGTATLGSRILGFVRDMLIASHFGTGILAEAFFAAFRIPNLFRRLFAEGALSSSFIPVFTEELTKKGKKEAFELAGAVFRLLTIILAGVVLAGIILSPFIVRLIVPGFAAQPEKLALTSDVLRLLFPYLFFIGLAALIMGVLNSLRHFATPAISPIILNISMIIFLIFFVSRSDKPIHGLAAAVVIGGIGQLSAQFIALRKKGVSLTGRFNMSHPMIKKITRLMAPAAFGLAVYQLNTFVDSICASYSSIVGEGAISALWYGNRVMQFPLAVFGIATATAIFPLLAKSASTGNTDKFRETVSYGLRMVTTLMIPSAVGLIVLRRPIISLLFERNEFTAYSTHIASSALAYYCIGLFAYGGVHILSRGFYSLQDMVTPVKAASAAMLCNIALNLILMRPMKVGGLALATSISAILNLALLLHYLRGRVGGLGGRRPIRWFLGILTASGLMGAVVWLVAGALSVETPSLWEKLIQVLASITAGAATFSLFRLKDLINFIKGSKPADSV